VIRVQAGGDDDVDVDLLVHPVQAPDVATEPDDGGVDDGVDASRLQLAQLADGVGDASLLVPPRVSVVLEDLRAEHEDVLVHERCAELVDVDGASDRLDLGHLPVPPRDGRLRVRG
jgi:hypothetical protein